tara:strand:- start:59 stop:3790 length:3732 start_codon:yes stop_codon:yes gene_type:complete
VVKTAAYQSQSYQDTLTEIDEYFAGQGIDNPTKEMVDIFIEYKDYDPETFRQQYTEYEEDIKSGGDATQGGTLGLRIPGRAVGELARGIYNVGEAFLPEGVMETVDSAIESIAEEMPDSVKTELTEVFDPYHGDGIGGTVEYLTGHIAPMAIGGLGIVKGITLGTKALNIPKLAIPLARKELSPAEYAKISTKHYDDVAKAGGMKVKKVLKPYDPSKQGRIFNKRELNLGKPIKLATGYAAGVTIVEDPEENLVNQMIEWFPETLDFLEPLAINPEDEKSTQYLDSFLNNLMLDAPFAALFLRAGSPTAKELAKAANRMEKSALVNSEHEVSSLMDKIRVPFRNFTSRRGTDEDTLASVIRNSQSGTSALTIVNALNKTLKEGMKQTFGRDVGQRNLELVNKALGGEKKALDELAKTVNPKTGQADVLDTVQEMRTMIDDLSGDISKNLNPGSLQATIDKNIGVYLNRSYRAFDDPTWKGIDEVDPATLEKARQYLLKKQNIPPQDVEAVLKYLAGGMKDKGAINFQKYDKFLNKLAEAQIRGTSPLSGKRNIAPQIRNLWGQYRDPFKSFGNTFEKLSVIKAEQQFLREIANNLKKRGLSSTVKGTGESLEKVGLDRISNLGKFAADNMDNPLKGLYADKAYTDMIQNGLDIMKPSGPIMRQWIKMKAWSQISKTVLSPATHARNIMGNNIMMVANGMLPIGKNAGKFISNRVLKLNDRKFAEEVAELQRLGVLDSDVKAGVIRSNLEDWAKFANEGRSHTRIDNILERARRGATKKFDPVFQLYRDEDNLYKMLHFNKTKQYLKKAYPDIPEGELMELAARRTRDLMPNYNLVSNALKGLRRWPVGDFLSFPAEMVRTSKNLAKYTIKDITSGNSTLRNAGLKRLAGMSTVGLGADIAVNQSMNVFGISEDQRKAIDESGPDYEKFVPKIFTSPINRDKSGRIGVDYVSLGPIDPYEYVKFFARATNEAVVGGLDPDRDVDWNQLSIAAFDKVLGPFVSPSMITEAALKLYKGEWDTMAPGSMEQALGYALDPFKPGFFPLLEKRRQFERSNEARKERGLGPIGKYGNTLTEKQTDLLPNLIGLGQRRRDITFGMYNKLYRQGKAVEGSKRAFRNSPSYKDQTLTGPENAEQLLDDYTTSQEFKIREVKRLKRLVEAFNILTPEGGTLSQEDFFRGITKDEQKEDPSQLIDLLYKVMSNEFEPDDLSENDMLYLQTLGKDLDLNKLYQIRDQLMNTKISRD